MNDIDEQPQKVLRRAFVIVQSLPCRFQKAGHPDIWGGYGMLAVVDDGAKTYV